jgi:peptidoglycan/xylan/chitin deacetylase (PgdA/CDA1 family)
MALTARWVRTDLHCFYYHIVGPDNVPHIRHLYKFKTAAQFEDDIDFLLRKYTPIDLSDLLDHIRRDRSLPRRAFLLSFDDGYREIAEVAAPILLRKGLTATLFLNSAFVDNQTMCYLNKASLVLDTLQSRWTKALEKPLAAILRTPVTGFANFRSLLLSVRYPDRASVDAICDCVGIDCIEYLRKARPYLSSDQISKLLAQGFTVGGHSTDHPLYACLPLSEQLRQTLESVIFVRRVFELRYGLFAFPHSDINVSARFFAELGATGLVDVSFGTAGLIRDTVRSNIQRLSLEKRLCPAEQIIAFHQLRLLKNALTGHSRIVRT